MFLKRLVAWLGLFLSWVKNGIPWVIGGDERIMRTIYHPANVNEKKGTVKPNFMRPPASKDEEDPSIHSNKLSTTRYDYAGLEFCRSHARAHQIEPNRYYWGFGRFVVEKLVKPCQIDGKEYSCTVKPKPVKDNPAHANINLGFRLPPGETLDSQLSQYTKRLAERAEILKDPKPMSEEWTGEKVDEPRHRLLLYNGGKEKLKQ
ncbi:MAG: hypothetical protein J6S89_10195 [Paludibacteraceae bacterium]|nr:hypothetical protein [Paludibacteraceae bacterium]